MALESFYCRLAIMIPVVTTLLLLQGLRSCNSAYTKCQKVTISSCTDLNYNHTIFPNLLQHRRQEDAESDLKQYDLLVQSECAPNLRFFLCVLFVPVCTVLERPLPPCFHLCDEVRKGCSALLIRYGFAWPDNFKCSKFPKAEEKVCVAPNPSPTKVPGKRKKWKGKSKEKVVEGRKGDTVTINCSGNGNTVNIRRVRSRCGKHPRAAKITLTSLCNGKKSCSFAFNETTFGGKCSSNRKYRIKYKCTKGGTRSTSAKVGQKIQLQCKGKREIRVVRASFGAESSGHTACRTPHAHCMLSQLCNGNRTCTVRAEPKEMDSNCRSKTAKLDAEYECVRRPEAPIQTARISGDTHILTISSCPGRKKLSIIHAKYGKGGRCQMYCVVFALCNGHGSCVIPNMAQFRLSCPGSANELDVRYQCV